MTRRRRWLIVIAAAAAVLLLAVAVTAIALKGRVVELVLEPAQLQSAVDAKLPFAKTYLLVFTATVPQATVLLEEGSSRLGVATTIDFNVAVGHEHQPLACALRATGGLRYDPASAAFYLDDPVIDSLDVKGVPERYRERVRQIAALVLREHFAAHPLYRLTNGTLKIQLARVLLRRVLVRDGRLHVWLGY